MNVAVAPVSRGVGTGFRFVQAVVSPRARGVSLRLNLNPDGHCNFDCHYCDVGRLGLKTCSTAPDLDVMIDEMVEALDRVRAGKAAELTGCGGAPAEYLRLGHVALSGSGEPTLCPVFEEVVERVMHVRAQGRHGFFKVALITNSSGLQEPRVRRGLKLFNPMDEIWAKLDAGTPDWFRQVNRADMSFEEVLGQIQATAQERPVVIQSLFPRMNGRSVPLAEHDAFANRIGDMVRGGAKIQMVQVYSASRPPLNGRCGHATLSELSAIARRVKETTGIRAQVF